MRQQEPVRSILLVHLVVRFQAVGAERVLTGEHLRVAEGTRTEPTFEELVVQLINEVRLNVAAIFAVIYRRHSRRCLTVCNLLLLRVSPREIVGSEQRRRGDRRLYLPLTQLTARLRTTHAVLQRLRSVYVHVTS